MRGSGRARFECESRGNAQHLLRSVVRGTECQTLVETLSRETGERI